MDGSYLIFPSSKGGQLSEMPLSATMRRLHDAEVASGTSGFVDRAGKRPDVPQDVTVEDVVRRFRDIAFADIANQVLSDDNHRPHLAARPKLGECTTDPSSGDIRTGTSLGLTSSRSRHRPEDRPRSHSLTRWTARTRQAPPSRPHVPSVAWGSVPRTAWSDGPFPGACSSV